MAFSAKKAVQVGVSVTLLLVLGFMVDWPTLVSTIASAAPLWLVLAAAAILVARFLITLRWRILLRLAGNQTPWWQLFGIVSAGIGSARCFRPLPARTSCAVRCLRDMNMAAPARRS